MIAIGAVLLLSGGMESCPVAAASPGSAAIRHGSETAKFAGVGKAAVTDRPRGDTRPVVGAAFPGISSAQRAEDVLRGPGYPGVPATDRTQAPAIGKALAADWGSVRVSV